MKNKRNLFVLLILFGMVLIPSKAYAVYNGSGAGTGASFGSCPLEEYEGLCLYNNGNHTSFKISLNYVYKDGLGNRYKSQVASTNSIIITTSASAIRIGCTTPDTSDPNIKKYVCGGVSVFEIGDINRTNVREKLMKYENGIITDMYDYYKAAIGITDEIFTESSTSPNPSGNGETYGYRIIVEPLVTATTHGNTQYGLYTVKEAADIGLMEAQQKRYLDVENENNARSEWVSTWLYTTIPDLGIPAVGSNDEAAQGAANTIGKDGIQSVVADVWSGYGYNIIDIPDSWHRCYRIKITSSPAVCTNKNENTGKFEQKTRKARCTADNPIDEINEDGKKFYENSACKVYCLETAYQKFPGNYLEGIPTNGKWNFVWPTNPSLSIENKYQLSFVGKLSCKVISTGNTRNQTHVNKCKNLKLVDLRYGQDDSGNDLFKTGVTLEYDNGKSTEQIVLKKYTTKSKCTGCKSGNIERNITINKTVVYKLGKNLNRYVKKFTNEYTNIKPGNDINYIDIGYANLPVFKNENRTNTYSLNLITTELGSENSFRDKIGTKYRCTYKSEDDDPSPCYCAVDSDYPNRLLLSDATDSQCYEAQVKDEDSDPSICYDYSTCPCPLDSDKPNNILSSEVPYGDKSCSKLQDEAREEQNARCYNSPSFCKCPSWSDNAGDELEMQPDSTCEQTVKSDIENVISDIKKIILMLTNNIPNETFTRRENNSKCWVVTADEESETGDCYCPIDSLYPTKVLEEGIFDTSESCKAKKDEEERKHLDGEYSVCYNNSYNCPTTDEDPDVLEDMSGVSLVDIMNEQNLSFDDAKKYCYNENLENRVCDDYPNVSLESCILEYGNDDNAVQICKALKCTKCYNIGYSNQKSINYRSCIEIKRKQGMTINTAKTACRKIACSDNQKNVIYRVISLENPFPSYNADKTYPTGLNTGIFNNSLRGRYPGLNWNNKGVVKNKILENRGYSGSSIYQSDDAPLYVFELTPAKIKKIRSYNASAARNGQGYNDFNLDCKLNNSRACVSSFVHDPKYGITTSGKCSGTLTKETFYSCAG